jgi:hypothetical protein
MRSTGNDAADQIARLLNAGSNPAFPQVDSGQVADILRRVLENANVSAYGSVTGSNPATAFVLGPAIDENTGVIEANVNARLKDFEVVEQVTVFDVTNNITYQWLVAMANAKAVKIAADGAQTFIGANGITVSGRVVTIGTAIAQAAAVCHYVIRGR